MAPKAVKIADINGPDKVAPAASSRPLLVTNRPVITDPMMVAVAEPTNQTASKTPMRSVKVIKPMTLSGSGSETDSEPAETKLEDTEKSPDSPEVGQPLSTTEQTSKVAPKTDTPNVTVEPNQTEIPGPESRDSDAAAERAKAQLVEAEIARQQELDAFIASEKYALQIGVEHRRSHMYVAILCIVGLVLALLLVDVLFDADIVSAPKSIPHTHFL